MRVGIATVVLLMTVGAASARGQRPATDVVTTPGGTLTIQPITHATLQIMQGNHVILVDPTAFASYEGPYPDGAAPRVNYDGLKPPTVILVTDIHGDHLDPSAIATLKGPRTTVLVPAVPGWQWFEGGTPIANGQTRAIDGVIVQAVPMYNLQRGPSAGQLFHTKGRGNGYVITVGGTRVYVAGDTECTPEMRALKNIDVAFLPMNLPYTMTPAEAAACAKVFAPRIVYPYHYRGQDVRVFEAALRDSGIDVRIRELVCRRIARSLASNDHRLATRPFRRHTHLAQVLELFAEDSWRNVYAVEREVRPPGAPTTGPAPDDSASVKPLAAGLDSEKPSRADPL